MTLRESELSRSERARRSPHKRTETEAQREQRLAEERAERKRLRARWAEDDDAVLTVKEWAALNGISVRQARRIIAGEVASVDPPIVTMLSKDRFGISRRHDREWKASRVRGRR
jgi:hypothetical protein